MNAEKTPFEDENFDAIFSYHSMHHMKDIHKLIKEMSRVCKNRGLIVISDLHARGRREYEHEPDKKFILDIERQLMKYANLIYS